MHPGFQILQHSTAHKLLGEPISEGKTTSHTYIPNGIYFPRVVVFSSTFTKAYTSISPKSSQSLSILPILRDPGNRLKRLNRENIVNTSHLFHISNPYTRIYHVYHCYKIPSFEMKLNYIRLWYISWDISITRSILYINNVIVYLFCLFCSSLIATFCNSQHSLLNSSHV